MLVMVSSVGDPLKLPLEYHGKSLSCNNPFKSMGTKGSALGQVRV